MNQRTTLITARKVLPSVIVEMARHTLRSSQHDREEAPIAARVSLRL